MYSIRGKYFEDWKVTDEFAAGASTVIKTDVVLFVALSGDYNPLQADEGLKKSLFSTRSRFVDPFYIDRPH